MDEPNLGQEKYRIRSLSGRVIGPFSLEQIGELYLNGRINGEEQFQSFPNGDWESLENFPDINQIIEDVMLGKVTVKSNYDSYSMDATESIVQEKIDSNSDDGPTDTDSSDPLTATRIHKKVNLEDFDKTQINPELAKMASKEKVTDEFDISLIKPEVEKKTKVTKEEKDLDSQEKTKKEIVPEKPKVTPGAATEIFDLKQLKSTNKNKATYLIEREESKDEKKEKSETKKKKKSAAQKTDKPKNFIQKFLLGKDPKRKGMKPVVVLAFVVILLFVFFDEDKPKTFVPEIPLFSFPVPFEQENPNKAKEFYEKGNKSYKVGTIRSKVKASEFYQKSLENKFQGNKSLGKLILTYSELLEVSLNKPKAGVVINKLIRIARAKALKDINVAMGTALFFYQFKKYNTSINTIENYLRVGKPSVKLLTVYLKILLKGGRYTKAKAVYDKLSKLKNKNVDVYDVLSDFTLINEDYQTTKKIVLEGTKKYKTSIPLLLKLAKLLIHNENFEKLKLVLKLMKGLEFEGSRIYYAKYLEFVGILHGVNGKFDLAAQTFKEALKFHEYEELRSKIASLEVGGNRRVASLILESKTLDLLRKSKRALRDKDYEKAFSYALEASDLSPTYVPAQIILSQIQISQGFYEESIKIMRKLIKEYPLSPIVNFHYLEALIKAYKIHDAKKHFQDLSTTKLFNTASYASWLAHMYATQEKYLLAIKWFRQAIKRDTLRDQDYYNLAKIYYRYKKFKRVKSTVTHAINLDPGNLDYRILYAQGLYELDGVEVAIGYLRSMLEKYPNNPQLIGEIAVYYHRAGQLKFFEESKKILEENYQKDKSLYVFLMKVAFLEDNTEEVLKNAREILNIDPGDLETRIKIGNYLIDIGKYGEAEKYFLEIQERLSSYPKLLYNLSRINFLKGNYEKAISLVNKEIEENPNVEEGYILLADIYRKQQKYLEAANFYKKAQLINNKSVPGLMGMAWIKYKQNHVESALDLYLKVTQIDPSNALAWRQLGLVYKSLGQGALALEALKVYLDQKPDAADRAQVEQVMRDLQ